MWWPREKIELNHDLEDIELIGDHCFILGVPINSTDEFKKRVFAGAKSYFMRLKSIDYTLKQYSNDWNLEIEHQESDKLILQITSNVKRQVISSLDYAMNIPEKPDIPNLFACSAALVRLQNTFQASVLTIRAGLHFEAAALERIILEQLAWIYTIHDVDNETHNFFDISPSKCIPNLKDLFPQVGKLYGKLSESNHISPKTTLRYIRPENDDIILKLITPRWSLEDAYLLLYLSDMYSVISEYIYRQLISECKYIKQKANGSFVPNPSRPAVKLLKETLNKINKLIQALKS